MTTTQAMNLMNDRTSEIKRSADRINGDIITMLFFSEAVTNWRETSGETNHDRYLSNRLREIIADWIPDSDKACTLDEIVTDYACYVEQVGFREGFNIALNILMQGMRFTTLPK